MFVDIVILIICLFFALDGLKRGFVLQALNILGFLTSLSSALVFYPHLANFLKSTFNIDRIVANPVAFLAIWLVVETTLFSAVEIFLNKLITKLHQININKFLGLFPAAVNAFLFLAFALLLVVSLPINGQFKKEIYDSKLGSPLVNVATTLEKPFVNIFGPITKETLTFLTVRPDAKETIPLEFTPISLNPDPISEEELYNLVNKVREQAGVKTLKKQESLSLVARDHSQDMFERKYFSHFSPEGKDVGDRLSEKGIAYSYAGENLALAPTIERAHLGLMQSPGHKRNILDPAFGKIGIGIIDGGIYGKMTTQIFTE